jgi:hypothetical protein
MAAIQRVKLLSQLAAAATITVELPSDSKEELFFEAMKEVLSADNRLNVPSTLKAMRGKVGPDVYYDAVSFVFRYMESSTGPLSRNEAHAMMVQLFKSYTNFMRQAIRIPVTVKTFFNTLDCFDAAIEQGYPGYKKHGFLKAVILPKDAIKVAIPVVDNFIFDPGA